jgi:hypothetical protein
LDGVLAPVEAPAPAFVATPAVPVTPGVRTCTDQWLKDGVQLPDAPAFYSRITPTGAWGSTTLVGLLQDAGRHMRWAMPKVSPFAVGDLSRQGGGPIAGHISHRGGVDADVGIYKTGGVQAARQFLNFAPAELDLAATWELMRFMLASGKVDFILLDRAHIARLKTWTLAQGLLGAEEAARIFPAEGSRDVWMRTGIVRHAAHHADHLHVRVLCSDGTRAGG